ncbi:hypothetical protein EAF56_20205 [Vibrio alginolyticus]|nr:hypothetical protein [Vibrio alginolyticus]
MRLVMAILVKSKTDPSIKNKWGTDPRAVVDGKILFRDATGKELVFDAAAEPQTAKFSRYLLPNDWIAGRRDWVSQLKDNNVPGGGPATCVGFDALQCDWEDGWWCNPPFDRKPEFIQKATEEMFKGRDGMMLLPYEPLSGWWIDYVDGYASMVYEPNGRYPFYEADGYTRKSGVNFGSVLLLFTRRKLSTPRQKYTKFMAEA